MSKQSETTTKSLTGTATYAQIHSRFRQSTLANQTGPVEKVTPRKNTTVGVSPTPAMVATKSIDPRIRGSSNATDETPKPVPMTSASVRAEERKARMTYEVPQSWLEMKIEEPKEGDVICPPEYIPRNQHFSPGKIGRRRAPTVRRRVRPQILEPQPQDEILVVTPLEPCRSSTAALGQDRQEQSSQNDVNGNLFESEDVNINLVKADVHEVEELKETNEAAEICKSSGQILTNSNFILVIILLFVLLTAAAGYICYFWIFTPAPPKSSWWKWWN